MTGRPCGLIGHTGFVGGTLARAAEAAGTPFAAAYHSRSVGTMRGERFGLVVCAGVPAVKWRANQDPAADQAGIATLMAALDGTEIAELVLVSTIDVYPAPSEGGDEATPIDAAANHAYGRHRFELEAWCRGRFPVVRVVRLPALFGAGLKKNALYDLLHGHRLEAINPAAVFQWYPLRRLWDDIGRVRRAGLGLVNLFPEPLSMRRVIDAVRPGIATGPGGWPAPVYDMGTRYGRLFGGGDRTIMSGEAVLAEMAGFAATVAG